MLARVLVHPHTEVGVRGFGLVRRHRCRDVTTRRHPYHLQSDAGEVALQRRAGDQLRLDGGECPVPESRVVRDVGEQARTSSDVVKRVDVASVAPPVDFDDVRKMVGHAEGPRLVRIFDALVAASDQMVRLPRGLDVYDVFRDVLYRGSERQRGCDRVRRHELL